MCLAIPLKILEIDGNTGICERSGITREIRLDFIDNPKVGEYVISHAGFAIERLDEQKAKENLEAYDEVDKAILELKQAMEEINKEVSHGN